MPACKAGLGKEGRGRGLSRGHRASENQRRRFNENFAMFKFSLRTDLTVGINQSHRITCAG